MTILHSARFLKYIRVFPLFVVFAAGVSSCSATSSTSEESASDDAAVLAAQFGAIQNKLISQCGSSFYESMPSSITEAEAQSACEYAITEAITTIKASKGVADVPDELAGVVFGFAETTDAQFALLISQYNSATRSNYWASFAGAIARSAFDVAVEYQYSVDVSALLQNQVAAAREHLSSISGMDLTNVFSYLIAESLRYGVSNSEIDDATNAVTSLMTSLEADFASLDATEARAIYDGVLFGFSYAEYLAGDDTSAKTSINDAGNTVLVALQVALASATNAAEVQSYASTLATSTPLDVSLGSAQVDSSDSSVDRAYYSLNRSMVSLIAAAMESYGEYGLYSAYLRFLLGLGSLRSVISSATDLTADCWSLTTAVILDPEGTTPASAGDIAAGSVTQTYLLHFAIDANGDEHYVSDTTMATYFETWSVPSCSGTADNTFAITTGINLGQISYKPKTSVGVDALIAAIQVDSPTYTPAVASTVKFRVMSVTYSDANTFDSVYRRLNDTFTASGTPAAIQISATASEP